MVITKRDLLAEVNRELKDYTLDEVREVVNTIERVALSHLKQANEDNAVTVKFGDGLSITSRIKTVDDAPRMWLKAKISRYFNRRIINEYEN